MNVKVTTDAADQAAEHFSQYPDIPMVVNADASNIPADAIRVDGLTDLDPSMLLGDHIVPVQESLTLAGIESMQVDAADAASPLDLEGAGDVVPGLTVLMAALTSSYREGRLIKDGKTSAERALKNVLVDTTMRGGAGLAGAVAGAKAGGMVDIATGGASLGLGALAGAALGAWGGGFVGGKGAKHLRLAPLRKAQESLTQELSDFDLAVQQEHERATSALAANVVITQDQLLGRCSETHRAYLELIAQIRRDLHSVAEVNPAVRAEILGHARQRVHGALQQFESKVDARPRGRRRVGTVEAAAVRTSVGRWEQRAEAVCRDDGAVSLSDFFDVVLASPQGEMATASYFQRLEEQRTHGRDLAIAANGRLLAILVTQRVDAVRAMRHARCAIIRKADTALRPRVQAVSSAGSEVWRELEAAGSM